MNVSTPLSDFCVIVQGGRHGLSGHDFVDHGFPAYGAGGMNGYLETFEFEQTAIVLSSIGARCGKCFLAENRWSSLANTQIILPDPEKADAKFLWFQLNDEARWHRSGTGQPFIKPSDVKRHTVWLPQIDEQRRLANILDIADKLRTKRRAALAKLDKLAQSVFIQMFGDPVTNPKNWRDDVPLGDVADIASGITKGRRLNGQPTRKVPYLAVVNVQDRHLVLDPLKEIDATSDEIERYRIHAGDLLLTEGGDPDKLGRGTLWNDEIPECIHQNHVFRVRLTSNEVEPLFLNWLVGSARGKKYFLRSAKQTTGIASINMTQLRAFPLLLPPLNVQREFASIVRAIDLETKRHERAAELTDRQFASLKHAAFRGEL